MWDLQEDVFGETAGRVGQDVRVKTEVKLPENQNQSEKEIN